MPQLDKFTYFSQFFWLCLFFFTFYIFICNDGDGVLGISRILKLWNQLLSHRGKTLLSKGRLGKNRSSDSSRFEVSALAAHYFIIFVVPKLGQFSTLYIIFFVCWG
uniref:H(+)-transporting two-sector ATPase n=1 Tax=Brassica napus TaxID=3708 RepID=Q31719_BRANA|nr:pol-urf [Brassica napus]